MNGYVPRPTQPEQRNGWPNGKVPYATPSSSTSQTFIRPTRHFLQAVEKIAPLFAQTWFNTIETNAVMTPEVQLNTVIPDGFKIAQIFRNQHSLKSNAAKGILPDTPSRKNRLHLA